LVSRETNPNIAAKSHIKHRKLQYCIEFHANDEEHPFEQWFVTWVRAAFQAKKDASAIHDLILWVKKLQDWEEKPKRNSFNFVSKCSAKR
jgi:DNA polymerase-3 subunit delta'